MLKSEDRSVCRSFLRWLCCGGIGAIPTVLFVAARTTVTLPPAHHPGHCQQQVQAFTALHAGCHRKSLLYQDLLKAESPSSLVELVLIPTVNSPRAPQGHSRHCIARIVWLLRYCKEDSRNLTRMSCLWLAYRPGKQYWRVRHSSQELQL